MPGIIRKLTQAEMADMLLNSCPDIERQMKKIGKVIKEAHNEND